MNIKGQFAFGVVALTTLCTATTLDLAWGMKLSTGQEILTISQNSEVLASACSRELQVDELHVKVDSDTEGNGNVTVGDNIYSLSNDSLCSASWNTQYVEVVCHLSFDVEFSSAPIVDGISECFGSEGDFEPFPTLSSNGTPEKYEADFDDDLSDDTSVNTSNPAETGLLSRQNLGCGGISYPKQRSNPAKPHKFRGWRQVTDGVNCKKGSGVTCTASRGETWSVTHTASIGITGLDRGAWISAGYSVGYSYGGSTTLGCSATEGRVCLRHMRRYQRYNVDEYRIACGVKQYQRTYWVRSPLTNDRDAGWHCHRGTNECDNAKGGLKWGDAGAGTW